MRICAAYPRKLSRFKGHYVLGLVEDLIRRDVWLRHSLASTLLVRTRFWNKARKGLWCGEWESPPIAPHRIPIYLLGKLLRCPARRRLGVLTSRSEVFFTYTVRRARGAFAEFRGILCRSYLPPCPAFTRREWLVVALELIILSGFLILFVSFLLNSSEDVSLLMYPYLAVVFKCFLSLRCGPHHHDICSSSFSRRSTKTRSVPAAIHTKRYSNILVYSTQISATSSFALTSIFLVSSCRRSRLLCLLAYMVLLYKCTYRWWWHNAIVGINGIISGDPVTDQPSHSLAAYLLFYYFFSPPCRFRFLCISLYTYAVSLFFVGPAFSFL